MGNRSLLARKVAFLACFLLTCSAACSSRGIPDSMGYLGQSHPGLVPEVFAPGIVSLDNQVEFNIAFTPDGREIYFTVGTRTETNIMFTKLENGHWTEPELAPFSREGANWSPFITGDGQNLYFVSDRPLDGSSRRSDPNIWMVERTEETWAEPQCLDEPIHSFYAEYTPFVASDGMLYFLSDRPGGYGGIDIYLSNPTNGEYSTVENLGEPINTPYSDEGLVMAQDGQHMILTSDRPGTRGDVDLYISIRNKDGSWQPPRNLGDEFNTAGPQYAPRFSLDERYFFFFTEGDMYWVDSQALYGSD